MHPAPCRICCPKGALLHRRGCMHEPAALRGAQSRQSDDLLAGATGEMAARIRAKDWSKTPLGRAETWSHSLRLSVALILASGFPMAVRWGPELITIYN